MKKLFVYLSLVALLLSVVSCKKKTDQQFDNTIIEEYPAIVITDTLSGNTSLKLYALKEDFVQRFLSVADDYQGTKVIMRTQFPTEWGLIGVERLPQGRELWLLQSQDREWTYLVITSGSGTQRILDVAPIGVDLARDENKALERELWTWERDDDGSFIVEKNYEWKKSIADATQASASNYVKKNYARDRYIIGDMGRFECFEENLQDTIPYNVVVLYNAARTDVENWEETTDMLEAFCEDNNIYYAKVNDNFNSVLVQDYTMNDIVTLDITSQMASDSVGMILYQNGKEPKQMKLRSVEYLQMEIRKYFK